MNTYPADPEMAKTSNLSVLKFYIIGMKKKSLEGLKTNFIGIIRDIEF